MMSARRFEDFRNHAVIRGMYGFVLAADDIPQLMAEADAGNAVPPIQHWIVLCRRE